MGRSERQLGAAAKVHNLLDRKSGDISQTTIRESEEASSLLNNASNFTITFAVILIITAIFAYTSVKRTIASPVEAFAERIEEAALNKNLAVEFDESSSSEIGMAARALNKLFDSFKAVLSTTLNEAQALTTASESMNNVMDSAGQTVLKQQDETRSLTATIDEFSHGIDSVTDQAKDAELGAEEGAKQSDIGYHEVQKTVDKIQSLASEVANVGNLITKFETESAHIKSLVEVIRQIADQTNLLALNAAIEAARAGDSGRGFAVVADEVRQLATRTQEATEEINGVIETLSQNMHESANAMVVTRETADTSVEQAQAAGNSLIQIQNAINTILEANKHIARTTEEHKQQMDSLRSRVSEVNDLSESVASETDKVTNETQNVFETVRTLRQEVTQYTGV